MGTTFNEAVTVAGDLSVSGSFTASGGGLANAAIAAAAKIAANKLRHYAIFNVFQAGPIKVTGSGTDTLLFGPIRRASIVTKISVAALTAPTGSNTIEIQVLIDGVSVLSGGSVVVLSVSNLTANRKAIELALKPSTDAEMNIVPASEDGFGEVVLSSLVDTGMANTCITIEVTTNE